MVNISSILFLILGLITEGKSEVTAEVVISPPEAEAGTIVSLSCRHSISSGDKLSSLKWYKDGKEFYRFCPSLIPVVQVFPLPSVYVDLSSSERETVRLVEVEVGTSGHYKCEVSGEAPYFHTATHSAELLVLVLPGGGPMISGAAPRYAPGDLVNLVCTSGPAHPSPSLTWYINGSPVNDSQLTEFPAEADEEGLMTSRLGLSLRAEYNSEDPEGGEMRLKCASSLGSIYWASREATLGPASSKLHTLRHIFSGGVRLESQLTMFMSILIFLYF